MRTPQRTTCGFACRLLLKLQLARVPLVSRPDGERSVELGTPGPDPPSSRRCLEQAGIQVSDDHRVRSLVSFCQDASVRIENHCVTGADLIVVHSHTIAEYQEQAVVMRAAGKPPHQPSPPLVTAEFALNRGRVRKSVGPQRRIDESHAVGILTSNTASLMGRE